MVAVWLLCGCHVVVMRMVINMCLICVGAMRMVTMRGRYVVAMGDEYGNEHGLQEKLLKLCER